jgi:putative lipoic acid-binding regulatory protein
MTRETIIEFPTEFPIKAMGRDTPEFKNAVIELVTAGAKFDPQTDVKIQPSNKGNFISVTVTFTAESQEQLDKIYQSLHDHELVLMVF